ncbi:pimeloyl-CoA dehydrogenase large subunit [Aurantiacibacter xanthus]|uniref:Pimeloyl-CoA dehydrogenase large subunit n=1 Tax=Aurantiacibacter xanthus TaxID=1784712 RepID=A0A3A1P5T0_9SPHN|nr:pimeloyl-CoA dehydrogenase large subunit [Aurantiacibacter xanthus]
MFTDEETAFAQEVRDFVRANLDPDVRRRVICAQPVSLEEKRVWHATLARQGWAAPHWPVEWGGTGWSPAKNYLFVETLAEEGAPELSPFGLQLLAPVLIRYGTEEQKRTYLPKILSGEHRWCQGFSEPGAGSDLASLKTRAVLDGDEWIINGQKMWTTVAHAADMMFCLVRTDPVAPKPQMGISMLIVDMKATSGVDVRPIMLLNGERTTNEVYFDNARVPAGNLVGEVNKGWNYTRVVLGNERLNIARVGLCKRQLRHLKDMVRQGGHVGGGLERLRQKIAAVELDLMGVEALSLRMLGRYQLGEAPGFEANFLKLKGAELQQRLTRLLVEARGPAALRLGADGAHSCLLKSHFDTRVVTIYGGSSEVQRNIVAKGMLGLGRQTATSGKGLSA